MRLFVKKKWLVLFLLCFIAAGLCYYLLSGSGDKEISRVVLISIDTCRSDYLSCYGHPLKITPNIDAIAEKGVLFENAISPIPFTLPSHSSIMTGVIPPVHGVHDNTGYQLGDSNVTLAEILKEKGFTTAAIVSTFILDSRFGLDQGFETYYDKFGEPYNARSISERPGMETSQIANSWLENHSDEKFFLFLHYYDPHFPYQSPEPFASKFKSLSFSGKMIASKDRDMPARYAGEVAYVDHCIGEVIEKLKKLKLFDSTLIIITSDHGEMLLEHNEISHGYFIYQSAVKVPLIFKLPGKNKSVRISHTVGLIDIAPTICSLLNIDTSTHFNGIDLQQYLSKKNTPGQRNIYCESFQATRYKANTLMGVVTDDWKYIQTTRPELYDLRSDPEELHNLASQQKQRARLLQDKLKEILEENVQDASIDNKLILDKEDMSRLESLGYLASNMVVESFEFDYTKKDPKDLIRFHSIYSNLNVAFSNRQYDMVKFLGEMLLKEDPTFAGPYYHLGTIAYEEGDYEKTAEYLSLYVEHDPGSHEIFNNLGLAYFHLNNHIDAVKNFEMAMQLAPDSGGVYYNLGREYFRVGNVGKAISHFHKAIELDPEHDKAKTELNRALKVQQKTEKAIKLYSAVLEKEPDSLIAHYNLASIYLQQGREDLAFQHCSKALVAAPEPIGFRLGIVSILMKLGRSQLALSEYNRILENSLDSFDGLNSIAWFQAASGIEVFRNPEDAVRHALKACEISKYSNPKALDTLAVAYASFGDFDKAIEISQKAIEITDSVQEKGLIGRIEDRIALYGDGKAYIDEAF